MALRRFNSRVTFKLLQESLAQSRTVIQTVKKAPASRREIVKTSKVSQYREKLPRLTVAEIRRYRVPLYEAILAELVENGYPNSSDFLEQLITYQEEYRTTHSYDVIIMSRPILTEDSEQLNYLNDQLILAETEHDNQNLAGEVEELLRIAVKYAFGPVDWWWLAEQFFAQCLNIVSGDGIGDDGYHQTMTYYIYGKYLVEQSKETTLGMQFLNRAREQSQGQIWTASRVTGQVEKYIFVEVCHVLYNVLMQLAHKVLRHNAPLALELTQEARQRGIDACLPRADVFYLLAECERANQQPSKAIGYFLKAFLLYKTNQQKEYCCESMIGLAMAYMEMGLLGQNKKQLEKLLAFAQKENLQSYVGQAYLYYGQYFLNAGTPEYASPYLTQALNIFIDLNDVARREFVKNLGAVSKGQETFQQYVKLILRCENHSNIAKRNCNIRRLLSWKSLRESFWEDMSETISEVSYAVEEQSVEWGELETIHVSSEMEGSNSESLEDVSNMV